MKKPPKHVWVLHGYETMTIGEQWAMLAFASKSSALRATSVITLDGENVMAKHLHRYTIDESQKKVKKKEKKQ